MEKAMMDSVTAREVGLRDGLQMIGRVLDTDRKIEWCRREAAAGVAAIEVTSFVPPKLLPQFADAECVAQASLCIDGLEVGALVPNLKARSAPRTPGCAKSISSCRRATSITCATYAARPRRRSTTSAGSSRGETQAASATCNSARAWPPRSAARSKERSIARACLLSSMRCCEPAPRRSRSRIRSVMPVRRRCVR